MNVLKSLTGATVAALFVAMAALPAFAAKTTPATDKNSAVPAVPRAIPDLIPYAKFDPPTSSMFDISKLTISGDIRVRPEFRNNVTFGGRKFNTSFVQQWTRLGFHYALSPDVVFFVQPQYSKNWGYNTGVADNTAVPDANGTGGTLFARQAYMLVRNFIVPNLTVKAGRQMVVWGNHRLFGHFDWNNVGWSHDGITTKYKFNNTASLEVGWLKTEDRQDCGSPTAGGCINGNGNGTATDEANLIFVRLPMKVVGATLEPVYIWQGGGSGLDGSTGARPADQSRHTVGARAVKKMPLGGARADLTVEGYQQSGSIGDGPGGVLNGKDADISAYAFHIDGGITLPVPMQPRLGGEFNMASGDEDADDGESGGFDQMYPTNHIHFGYMDRMAWKNMVHYSAGLQLRPSKNSHFEVTGHWFSLNEEADGWYGANQNAIPGFAADPNNNEDDIGSEVDLVYTQFFTPGNHVGWQVGGGVFFPGDYVDSKRDGDASEQTWGYTQLWINF